MMEIDTQKDLFDITDPEELKMYIKSILEKASMFHPCYPNYVYDYNNGKLVSVRKADGKIIT